MLKYFAQVLNIRSKISEINLVKARNFLQKVLLLLNTKSLAENFTQWS